MDKKILSALAKMDDTTFITLEHHFRVARMVRNAMCENGMDAKAMATVLKVPVKAMKAVINGGYSFDIGHLSSLQYFIQRTAAEKVRIEVEMEHYRFGEYKKQYPVYLEKLDRLTALLTAKELAAHPDGLNNKPVKG